MDLLLPCIYAFFSCVGFSLMFKLKKIRFILGACLVGTFGWLVYLLLDSMGDNVMRYFIATLIVSVCSELCARIMKAPATIFLIIGIVPLVPGGGLYYTMEHLLNGDSPAFSQKLVQTGAIAATIAVGVSLVSSTVRLLNWKKQT